MRRLENTGARYAVGRGRWPASSCAYRPRGGAVSLWRERETGGQTYRRRCRDAVPSICQYLVALGIFGVLRGKRACNSSTFRVSVFSSRREPRATVSVYLRRSSCRSLSFVRVSPGSPESGFHLAFTRTNGGRCEPGRASSGVRVSKYDTPYVRGRSRE